MIKRLLKCVLLALVIGIPLCLGLIRYQEDQYEIRYQIGQIQRQQTILVMGTLELNSIVADTLDVVDLLATNPLPALIKEVAPSVVYVEANYWSGSGVIVGQHTVLTARHVVHDAEYLIVETVDGESHRAI